jgi:hypothetical protein
MQGFRPRFFIMKSLKNSFMDKISTFLIRKCVLFYLREGLPSSRSIVMKFVDFERSVGMSPAWIGSRSPIDRDHIHHPGYG